MLKSCIACMSNNNNFDHNGVTLRNRRYKNVPWIEISACAAFVLSSSTDCGLGRGDDNYGRFTGLVAMTRWRYNRLNIVDNDETCPKWNISVIIILEDRCIQVPKPREDVSPWRVFIDSATIIRMFATRHGKSRLSMRAVGIFAYYRKSIRILTQVGL